MVTTKPIHALVPTLVVGTLAIAFHSSAIAERPMQVDDAGTLDPKGTKIEFGWSRDAGARGYDLAAGFAPIEHLELEVGLARLRDRAADPLATHRVAGAAIKWVPLQSEHGPSAGLKYEYGNDRIRNTAHTVTNSIAALFTWTFGSGIRLHANAGHEWQRAEGVTDAATTWGIGADLPLTSVLHLTAETLGARGQRPDRQLGIRYEIAEGLKVSAAVGEGDGRTFGSLGVAWEF